jgi:excisionase family DNA binding protein
MAPEVADSPFLTIAEAARYWRVSERTVMRHVASGEIPAVRVGRAAARGLIHAGARSSLKPRGLNRF